MRMKKQISAAALCLIVALLLSSCSVAYDTLADVGAMLAEPFKKPAKVDMTFYVQSVAQDEDNSITSSDLDASQKAIIECISILESENVLDATAQEVGYGSVNRFCDMLSVEAVNETSMVKVTFSSEQYTAEQLKEIADAYATIAPPYVESTMLGMITIAVVDRPRVVEKERMF